MGHGKMNCTCQSPEAEYCRLDMLTGKTGTLPSFSSSTRDTSVVNKQAGLVRLLNFISYSQESKLIHRSYCYK